MPQTAARKSEEYWRPADPVTARIARPILAEGLCPDCSTEYPTAARFCPACGRERYRRPGAAPSPMTFADFFDVAVIRQRLGLSVLSLVFFMVGVVCLAITLSIGILYKPETLVQWQALQFWRVEWLLGAAAAMLAGILLKK